MASRSVRSLRRRRDGKLRARRRRRELFFHGAAGYTTQVGILRRRNAIHKILKFPHVVSRRERANERASKRPPRARTVAPTARERRQRRHVLPESYVRLVSSTTCRIYFYLRGCFFISAFRRTLTPGTATAWRFSGMRRDASRVTRSNGKCFQPRVFFLNVGKLEKNILQQLYIDRCVMIMFLNFAVTENWSAVYVCARILR